jgi:hypothetical protein
MEQQMLVFHIRDNMTDRLTLIEHFATLTYGSNHSTHLTV